MIIILNALLEESLGVYIRHHHHSSSFSSPILLLLLFTENFCHSSVIVVEYGIYTRSLFIHRERETHIYYCQTADFRSTELERLTSSLCFSIMSYALLIFNKG
jgi:hypothetical protein